MRSVRNLLTQLAFSFGVVCHWHPSRKKGFSKIADIHDEPVKDVGRVHKGGDPHSKDNKQVKKNI